ncbi:secD/SecF GG Motif family protein, partial [Chlamydia psittaci 06-1683]
PKVFRLFMVYSTKSRRYFPGSSE